MFYDGQPCDGPMGSVETTHVVSPSSCARREDPISSYYISRSLVTTVRRLVGNHIFVLGMFRVSKRP